MDDERRRDRDPRATPTLRPREPTAHATRSGDIGSDATITPEAAIAHGATMAVGSGIAQPGAPRPAGGSDLLDNVPPGVQPMIGHFAIRYRLGEGGMGVVYAGVDAQLGRPVALKVVRAEVDSDGYRARLLREAQAMARLEHPNVVRVYEIGNDAGRLFVAMEYIDGETLSRWLRSPRAWPDVVAMFEQVGAGLAAVHAVGLVHRDFKPDNVLVDRGGRARVADFGLARLDVRGTVSPLGEPLTQTGAVMGTPAYMAPEQQFGERVDSRADQYSFCVALREALIAAGAWEAVPELRAVVVRGLAYDASERFASMAALLDAMRGVRERATGAVAAAAVAAAAAPAIAAGGASSAPTGVVSEPGALPVVASQLATRPVAKRSRGLAIALVSLGVIAAGATTIAIVNSGGDPPASRRTDPPVQPVAVQTPVDAAVAPPPAPAPSDAQVVAEIPQDAATAKPKHAHDAGLAVATAPTTPPPAPAVGSGSAIGNGLPNVTQEPPQDGRLPASKVDDPGHIAVVRSVIRDLGYDTIDLGALDRDPKAAAAAFQTEYDAAADHAKLVAGVKLGLAARRRGDCGAAEPLLQAAAKGLPFHDDPDAAWSARAWFSLGLCALADKRVKDAHDAVGRAFGGGNQSEVRLVLAIIFYEEGQRETAHAMIQIASQLRDARVNDAVVRWLTGTGLKL
jgi:predicted Ser/Thr protein kinase|nr:serine/threonine-protein kinase [Kofleriaceae bacterium]